jgi:hypothetical protein
MAHGATDASVLRNIVEQLEVMQIHRIRGSRGRGTDTNSSAPQVLAQAMPRIEFID